MHVDDYITCDWNSNNNSSLNDYNNHNNKNNICSIYKSIEGNDDNPLSTAFAVQYIIEDTNGIWNINKIIIFLLLYFQFVNELIFSIVFYR
jgi:hypothetical protein